MKICIKSKISKNNKPFTVLCLTDGVKDLFITFDIVTMCRFFGADILKNVLALKPNDELVIADVKVVK